MAKHFYVTQHIEKKNKMYGYFVIGVRVFTINKQGTPLTVHYYTYQTGSTPGVETATLRELAKKGTIPAKYATLNYYDQKAIKIHPMGSY